MSHFTLCHFLHTFSCISPPHMHTPPTYALTYLPRAHTHLPHALTHFPTCAHIHTPPTCTHTSLHMHTSHTSHIHSHTSYIHTPPTCTLHTPLPQVVQENEAVDIPAWCRVGEGGQVDGQNGRVLAVSSSPSHIHTPHTYTHLTHTLHIHMPHSHTQV